MITTNCYVRNHFLALIRKLNKAGAKRRVVKVRRLGNVVCWKVIHE